MVEVDVFKGGCDSPEFLAINPNGRIPVLKLEDGRSLPESNAILFYLSEGTSFLSSDRFGRADTLQWLFFEQYEHEPTIAVRRYWAMKGLLEEKGDLAKETLEKGYEALEVMEKHLASRNFLVADRYSIADISLYAYTHVAHQGGYDLERFPAIRAWIKRIQEQPKYIAGVYDY